MYRYGNAKMKNTPSLFFFSSPSPFASQLIVICFAQSTRMDMKERLKLAKRHIVLFRSIVTYPRETRVVERKECSLILSRIKWCDSYPIGSSLSSDRHKLLAVLMITIRVQGPRLILPSTTKKRLEKMLFSIRCFDHRQNDLNNILRRRSWREALLNIDTTSEHGV